MNDPILAAAHAANLSAPLVPVPLRGGTLRTTATEVRDAGNRTIAEPQARGAALQSLQQLLDRYETTANEDSGKPADAAKLFESRFRHHVWTVIRPVMKNFGEILLERGHDYEIKIREYPDRDGAKPIGSIALVMYPDRSRFRALAPEGSYVGYHALPAQQQIRLRLISVPKWSPEGAFVGFASGDAGRRQLAELTAERVEQEILGVVGAVFRLPPG